MKPAELRALLQEFYRDKVTLRARHEAAARAVPDYNFNNTYQYIIAREDVQLSWLQAALQAMSIPIPDHPVTVGSQDQGNGRHEALKTVLSTDVELAQSFIDRWTDRVDGMTHARHRSMLRVILGETLEHKRFFEQALAGRADLLGRHADGTGTVGQVLPTRGTE